MRNRKILTGFCSTICWLATSILSVQPGLAERWEIPDPKTYIFHLHPGVKFSDGRPLTARDVKWSFDSLLQGKVRSTKASDLSLRRSH